MLKQRLARLAPLAIVCAAVLSVAPASAGAAGHFFQGFKSSTSGWCDEPFTPCDGVGTGTINRVPSN
jgi:hypothetical protein